MTPTPTQLAREKKIKSTDTMNVDNVEEFIKGGLKSYMDKNMLVDALFWREACRLLIEKYKGKSA